MPNEIEMIEQSKNALDKKEIGWLEIIGGMALIAAIFIIF